MKSSLVEYLINNHCIICCQYSFQVKLFIFILFYFPFFFLTLCRYVSPSSFRSWSMWVSWQKSQEMFSAPKCWRGVLLEKWSSGLTSSLPSMFWDITSRYPCLSRSYRGELLCVLKCHHYHDISPSVNQHLPLCRKDQAVNVQVKDTGTAENSN